MGHRFLRGFLPVLLLPPPRRSPHLKLNLEPVSPSKRPRSHLMAPPRIGTHNGTFHCDEALACALLRLLPEYRDAEIVRTRDPEKLAACDIVVDVGGEYDPQRHRYDHHQRSFTETMSSLSPGKPWQTKLSSAGLIYLHFGHKLLAQLLGTSEEDGMVGTLYDKMYENFVEEVDAVDNGISQWEEGEPRYLLTTTLSARVARLNPTWNQPNQDTEAGFKRAMDLVREEFLQRLDFYQNSWLPARALVEEALAKRFQVCAWEEALWPWLVSTGRLLACLGLCSYPEPSVPAPLPFQVDPSGEIIELAKGGCPWKEHLYQLESGLSPTGTIAFVIYTDQAGQWRVQCVPKEPHSFQSRLPLPEPWRGLRDEALDQISGIPGCVFVHASGFIGGHRTREGALSMARATLAQRPAPTPAQDPLVQ
ncbi:MYG1 exonuclease isoform X1 [Cervus canadensis]|uniref:MYG1 exonuclease isoform X1 n=1 Tax=Cervus canadensis TaxID=1574408 RepID=UPI001CA34BB9|nr:MYG1 exonuclease isoform X1 [Cervus canadensis]